MSQNTLINVGVGVALAAVSYFTFGTATAALFAFSIGATASSLILGPDTPKGNKGPKPDEIEFNQSSENATVPVVFGTTRVSANFIYVGKDRLKTKPIKKKGEGKGAKSETVGFRYTFPLSYGICMGKVDKLIRIVGSPGLDVMTNIGSGISMGTGGETLDVIYQKKTNGQEAYEGGSATFYPGSASQGGATTTDTNHRYVCWINFPSYRIDGATSPRSLLFELQRFPVVAYDNGTLVSDFPNRAAVSDANSEYSDANPAAVAWECLTNKIWGAAKTSEQLDVASFRAAAKYYQANNLGVSTAQDATTLSTLMQTLRDLFGLLIWWDGDKLRALCVYDPAAAYASKVRIYSDDVVGTPDFSRPSSAGAMNEIRLEFTNRQNNWQSEIATAMDLAAAETIGGIRSQSVDGREIGTRAAAEKIAHQMLRQMAYPAASCQLKLRRTFSGLQPGSFIELLWDEWRESGMATTYWRVIDVEDDDQTADGVTVSMMEDIYSFARDGSPGAWGRPTSLISEDDSLTDDDFGGGDITTVQPAGSIEPIVIWEPNIFVTSATRAIVVLPTRERPYIEQVGLAWSYDGDLTTYPLENSAMLPINGKLLTNIPADGPKLARGAANEFEIELFHPDDAATFEGETGLVQTDSDDFSALLRTSESYLLIGAEIFRIGFAEETSPGVMTVRTYVRGELGTDREAHAIDDVASFMATLDAGAITPASDIPKTLPVNLSVTPLASQPVTDADTVITPGGGIVLAGNSVNPFTPSLLSASKVGTTWTVRIRPRLWTSGAETRPGLEDDLTALVTELAGLSLRLQKGSGGDAVIVPAASYTTPPFPMPTELSIDAVTWIPDTGATGTGLVELVVTFDINPATLEIWSVRDGAFSPISLSIPTP